MFTESFIKKGWERIPIHACASRTLKCPFFFKKNQTNNQKQKDCTILYSFVYFYLFPVLIFHFLKNRFLAFMPQNMAWR